MEHAGIPRPSSLMVYCWMILHNPLATAKKCRMQLEVFEVFGVEVFEVPQKEFPAFECIGPCHGILQRGQ